MQLAAMLTLLTWWIWLIFLVSWCWWNQTLSKISTSSWGLFHPIPLCTDVKIPNFVSLLEYSWTGRDQLQQLSCWWFKYTSSTYPAYWGRTYWESLLDVIKRTFWLLDHLLVGHLQKQRFQVLLCWYCSYSHAVRNTKRLILIVTDWCNIKESNSKSGGTECSTNVTYCRKGLIQPRRKIFMVLQSLSGDGDGTLTSAPSAAQSKHSV